MYRLINRDSISCMIILFGLLGLEAVERFDLAPPQLLEAMHRVVRTAQSREMNREAREALTGGYYEGLLNEGSRVSSMNAIVSGTPMLDTGTSRPGRRIRKDFLYYDYPPGLDLVEDGDERLRLITNSHGMADREYTLDKPSGVRRIALLGDSITRGMGAPFGMAYEALLEEELNTTYRSAAIRGFEVLNFSVSGYRITQTLEVALERAPAFAPDVYLVALSDLSVFRRWGHHLGQLIYDGIDLKYPYLKGLARDAQLSPKDPFSTLDAKLARYRLQTIRWILSEIQGRAARDGAEMIVVMVPTVDTADLLQEEFIGIRELIAELGIPYIDLLDTFSGVEGLAPYRVSDSNRHPNATGHRRLFERLRRRMESEPVLLRKMTGQTATEGVPR